MSMPSIPCPQNLLHWWIHIWKGKKDWTKALLFLSDTADFPNQLCHLYLVNSNAAVKENVPQRSANANKMKLHAISIVVVTRTSVKTSNLSKQLY